MFSPPRIQCVFFSRDGVTITDDAATINLFPSSILFLATRTHLANLSMPMTFDAKRRFALPETTLRTES
jgi:hypothetical protein